MSEFQYTALDPQGREVVGALQAEDRRTALARLKSQGMHPLVLEAAVAGGGRAGAALTAQSPADGAVEPSAGGGFVLFQRRVSASDLSLFTRQLASLFGAGLNLDRCLETLQDHSDHPVLQNTVGRLRQSVQGGVPLWEAMGEHPRVFSDLYVNLVRAGEASGQLGPVLERLADSLEISEEQRSRLRAAMAYPILLLSAGMGAVIFILVFLVPRFAKIFGSLNRPLPLPTLILLKIQTFVSQWGWLVGLALVGAYFGIRAWGATDNGGLILDRFRMRLPLVGQIIHKDALSRFCRTLATLVRGGVPILTSFEVAERAVGNRVLQQAIVQVRDAVRGGESLAGPLRATGVFPSLVTNMIRVGEETGNLEEMLTRVADAYDAELANRTRQLLSMVEPAVILLMGGIIGTIVISMLVPVLELSTGM